MRKTLNEMTKNIRSQLRRDEQIKDKVDVIIPVEFMAVSLDEMNVDIPIHEAWCLLTGYNEPVLPKHLPKKYLYRLRILMFPYSGESWWITLTEQYQQIPKEQRLLEIDHQGYVTFRMPRTASDRRAKYEEILQAPIPYKPTPKKFASAGEFIYEKTRGELSVQFKGFIPEKWVQDYPRLERYRTKKEIDLEAPFDFVGIAKEMDAHINDGKKEWENRARPIRLTSIKDNAKNFSFQGLQHIAGGLASGKSTFRMIATYWLTKHKHAKVGMLEESVTEVFKTVQLLKSFGIHAVPVIGKSTRHSHLKDYLKSQKYKSFHTLTEEPVKHLSGVCSIEALAGDEEGVNDTDYPCERIISGNKQKKICPLIKHCGVFRDWSELVEADVWVTTSAAVLYINLPAMIDPYKRTLYEAMYDLLDVIFVDEADQVQQTFEDTFLNEYPAFGDPANFLEYLNRQFVDDIQMNKSFIGNPYVEIWEKNIHHLQQCVRQLLGKLKVSQIARNMFKRNVVYLNDLIHDISKRITDHPVHSYQHEQFKNLLLTYARSVSYKQQESTEQELQMILDESNYDDKINLIQKWFVKHQISLPKDKRKTRKLYLQIELFVYLANIEAALKQLQAYLPLMRQYISIDHIPMLSMKSDFRPFTKEAMTAVMFGYRYEETDGEELGHFKVIQYMAVGRELLHQWHHIYEEADERQGPAVILLSGTSYAPHSLHYHIEHEPNWLLTSIQQKPNLKQQFLPVRDSRNNEEPVMISGLRSEQERNESIETMVIELTRNIEHELIYWTNKGSQRRVLLVVNSYDDVEVVGEALAKIEKWKGRYRLLSRKHQKDDIWFPRSMISLFGDEKEEILVAPMMAISRGHNIIKNHQALFGTAFFLIRPYPVPNDLSYFVNILHGHLPLFCKELYQNKKQYVRAIRHIRKKSRSKFEKMYEKPSFWSILTEEERFVMAWYTFIPTWQLIGRLLRNGSDARVFYCDWKFLTDDEKDGMLSYWEKIMQETDDHIFNHLYGPFKESIQGITKGEVDTLWIS